ncbi:acetyltransferase family protein, partial [Streptococcus agalactiae CF01173]
PPPPPAMKTMFSRLATCFILTTGVMAI